MSILALKVDSQKDLWLGVFFGASCTALAVSICLLLVYSNDAATLDAAALAASICAGVLLLFVFGTAYLTWAEFWRRPDVSLSWARWSIRAVLLACVSAFFIVDAYTFELTWDAVNTARFGSVTLPGFRVSSVASNPGESLGSILLGAIVLFSTTVNEIAFHCLYSHSYREFNPTEAEA